jgi:hypothetical protein
MTRRESRTSSLSRLEQVEKTGLFLLMFQRPARSGETGSRFSLLDGLPEAGDLDERKRAVLGQSVIKKHKLPNFGVIMKKTDIYIDLQPFYATIIYSKSRYQGRKDIDLRPSCGEINEH